MNLQKLSVSVLVSSISVITLWRILKNDMNLFNIYWSFRISGNAIKCLVTKSADIAQPSRSPDLTPPNFFLWGYIKTKHAQAILVPLVSSRQTLVPKSSLPNAPPKIFERVIEPSKKLAVTKKGNTPYTSICHTLKHIKVKLNCDNLAVLWLTKSLMN